MTVAQTPTTPDLSFLQELDPDVAKWALLVIAFGMFLYYFGGTIRDRLAKKSPVAAQTDNTQPAIPVVAPTPAAAVDKADRLTDQLIGVLKDQLASTERERDDAKRERDELQRRLDRSEHENDRLRWQRGGS